MTFNKSDLLSEVVEKRLRDFCLFLAVSFLCFSFILFSIKPIYIEDSGTTKQVMTAKHDVLSILSSQNIFLNNADTVEAPDNLSFFSTIKITRSVEVRLTYPGGGKIFYAPPDTVQNIVAANYEGFDPNHDIIISPSDNDTVLTANASHPIEIISPPKIESIVLKEKQSISYDTVYESEPLLPRKQKAVMNQGTDGSLEVSYRVYLKDGEPIGKSEISRLVLSEPTDKIIRIGSGAKDSIEIKEKEIIINGTAYPFRAVYDMRATAYSLGKRTATGTPTHRGVVAVDPSVIPYFSRLFIISSDGTSWSYGFASAEDTGSSIKGNKIDLFMDGMALARRFGVKSCKVYVLK